MKVTSSIRHIVLTAVFLLASGAVSAANSSILVELNKLEDRNGACRAYLIVENKDTTKFETLNLDLVMFDVEGIVVGAVGVRHGAAPDRKDQPQGFRHRRFDMLADWSPASQRRHFLRR